MLNGSLESNRGARGAKCAAPKNEVFCETYVEKKKKTIMTEQAPQTHNILQRLCNSVFITIQQHDVIISV